MKLGPLQREWFPARCLCAALLVFPPAGLFAQGQAPAPSVQEILQKTIQRAKWSEEQNLDAKYTYTQRSTVDELDTHDRVRKHEERLSQVAPLDGEPFARLVQKDGKPLTEKDLKQEQERERKFRERQAEKKRKHEQGKKGEDEVDFNDELVSRYRFDLTGQEPVNGRPAFVLSFQPRSNDLPVKRKIDRLLNKVAGRLWIDEQDYEIARADVAAENVSAWGGLLASVRKFVLRAEQTKVDDAVWLPSLVDAYVDGRIVIKSLHLKLQQRNGDFRRIASQADPPNASKP